MSDVDFALRLLRFDDLKRQQIVRNRMTLRRWMSMADDPFPQPIRLGLNSIAWRAEDVAAWLERREAASRPEGR